MPEPPPHPDQTIQLGGGGAWERQTPDHIYRGSAIHVHIQV